ncbi:YwqG family protein [Treponema saccharophilum]|uniref:DUF7822 domain-containing protein n=1 Tax=Treponema saccharophilum DSM 2985 TaxID=907348 RepID=H7EL47_9SPIR|nr:YwqG family protein [Treponema saccharophilum]EIC01772.1 protein of unknown function DUF1963 [Treponema saccharophilum DSM 2985]BDC97151.1 hypothetical protein TRSA_22500 [Treponema saccharophilum]
MANRSYLYSLDVFPNYLKPRAIGLSESEYNIPLIYRILVSSAPQATESILFSGQGKIAITADYDGGVRKLEEFFSKLPQEYKEKADNVIKFLKDYKNRQLYIHLECAEIFAMEAESDDELEKKNAELVEEIKNIDEEIKKALKRIHYDGDTFDVREIEAKYWTNTLYFMPDSEDNVKEDEEPKPNAKLEPEQAHNEAKSDDIESYLAEPEYHQYGYGGGFFALIIKEGEKVALPLEPEKMFEEREYRLFVLSKDDEKLGEIEYHRAIELIRKFAYFETTDKVDGFDCLFFQNPPEKEFLLQILKEAQTENASAEITEPVAPQNPRITRTLVHGVRPTYFETVHVEGDENNPAGIEMARTVLTRAQSDAAMDFVFSESTQIDTDEDDEVFPIDSFSFYWAIQYCNALSITCALEPCYSIDGETNPRKWGSAPYSEYNSYTEKVNSDYENEEKYKRIVFNPNANGWRLPTLDECKRAAKTDGIQKDTIAELGLLLWVWRDDIPSHSAIISSNWNKEDLTAPFASPEVATPQYSIRICRNGGTVLPETVYYDWRKAKEEAEEYEEEAESYDENFNKEALERRAEEFYQSYKTQKSERAEKKQSKIKWSDILLPILIVIVGIILFALTHSRVVFYFVAFLFFIFSKNREDRKSSASSNDSNPYDYWTSKTKNLEVVKESDEQETPDYAGWWNYKSDGMNDFQHNQDSSVKSNDESENGNVGKYTHEQAKWILQRIHDTDGAETIRIKTAVKGTPLPLTASKFGGLPYWERTNEYPKSENGEPLYLLAQINFADVPHLPDFPEKGLLQIFVQAGDTWGLDFKDEKQKNWRIVYHKTISSIMAMSEADLRAMGVKTASDEKDEDEYLPFEKEYALSFEKQLTFVHPNCDDQFDDTVQAIAQELGFPVFDGGALDWFEEDDYNAFCVGEDYAQHQIGGFPNFTQNDVRRVGDVLLFQMDSEMGNGEDGKSKDWEILWGDCGIANFFISRADLKNLDFSNVLYNWDCY